MKAKHLFKTFWIPSLIVGLGFACSTSAFWTVKQTVLSHANTYGLLILSFCLLSTHGSKIRLIRFGFATLGISLCIFRLWWFLQQPKATTLFQFWGPTFLWNDLNLLPISFAIGGLIFISFYVIEEIYWPHQVKKDRVLTSFAALFAFSFVSVGVMRPFFKGSEGFYILSLTRLQPFDAFCVQALASFYMFEAWRAYHRQFSLYRTSLSLALAGGCILAFVTSGIEKQIYTVTINQMERKIIEIQEALREESEHRISIISVFTDYLLTVPSPTEEKLNSMMRKLNSQSEILPPSVYFFDRNLELKWVYQNNKFYWGRAAQTELVGRKSFFVNYLSQQNEPHQILHRNGSDGRSVSFANRLQKNGRMLGYLVFEEQLNHHLKFFFKKASFGPFLTDISFADNHSIIRSNEVANFFVTSEGTLDYLGVPLKVILRPGRSLAINSVLIPQLSLIVVGILIISALIYTIYVNRKRVIDVEKEVLDRIQELKLLKEEADQAKLFAEHASYVKSQFLANMSHEIRTPLNVLLGASELLSETELTLEQKKYVQMFQTSGRHLLGLLNDIIDLSRIESGQLETEKISFDLNRTLEFVRNLFSLKAQEHGVSFEVEKIGIPLTVRIGDPLRIRQILVNLIGNAFKFTKQGSIRLIVSEPYPNQIRFTVEDTGVGIPAEKQKEIFDTFQQGDVSFSRKHGGAGLGLAISRNLSELMGGSIELVSELGKGSKFIVEIPLPAATLKPTVTNDTKAGLLLNSDRSSQTEGHLVSEKPSETPNHFSTKRVLLVDDSDDNRFLVKLFLEKSSFEIVEAQNGEEAVRLAQRQSFDLIIMDMQMPVLDGYEAVKQIREWEAQLPDHKSTPILALTAHGTSTERAKCLDIGCTDYLSKPVTKSLLTSRISHLTSPVSLERIL